MPLSSLAAPAGNTYPPEHYRQAIENFNVSEFDSEDYRLGTTRLVNGVEEEWFW
jgi:hypothetical protein